MTHPLRVGILGGCLNSGYGLVSLNQLYHRIAARELEDITHERVHVRLGRLDTHQHDRIAERVDTFLQKQSPDLLLLQIRPDFLWGLYSALWLTREGKSLQRLRCNPHSQYGDLWPENIEQGLCPMHGFAPINLRLARLTGMTRSADARLVKLVTTAHQICQRRNVAMGLISPLYGSYYHQSFQQFNREHILPLLQSCHIPLCDLLNHEPLHDTRCWADTFHLNAEGHLHAAQVFLPTLLALCRDVGLNIVPQEKIGVPDESSRVETRS